MADFGYSFPPSHSQESVLTRSHSNSKKRKKRSGTSSPAPRKIDDMDNIGFASKKRKAGSPSSGKDPEKRLRLFRKEPPQSYLQKLDRALSQRMFVIGRTRGGTDDIPQETIEIVGTTGNIYHVRIGLVPNCTCPDNMKGHQCKHIIYVLRNVLKAPRHLQYQLAFISAELREIFGNAPSSLSASSTSPSNRKEISGDCPICFTQLEPEDDEVIWCKATCGNNIHRHCFEQWAESQKPKAVVTCIFCRTPWQGNEHLIKKIRTRGKIGRDGYLNVAPELGLSGRRDTSTYHQHWVRRQYHGH